MQSAIDRQTGERVYAAFIDPEIWQAEFRYEKRWPDGGLRLECPVCGKPALGKCGYDELAQLPVHFAHKVDEQCPYRRKKGESEEHILLKQEVARIVRAYGWQAELEVPGPNWRTDLLATGQAKAGPTGRLFNVDVIYASTRERKVAFEVQVTPQSPTSTAERTARYHDAGVEVVWLLCWVEAEAWGDPHAVSVLDPSHTVSSGVRCWSPGDGWVEPTDVLSLTAFIEHVLNGELQNRRRRWTTGSTTFEWVLQRDVEHESRQHEITERLKARRAEATRRIEQELRRLGLRPTTRLGGLPDAYATVITWYEAASAGYSVAVHPAPRKVKSAAARLKDYDALVVDGERERERAIEQLSGAGQVLLAGDLIKQVETRLRAPVPDRRGAVAATTPTLANPVIKPAVRRRRWWRRFWSDIDA